MKDRKNATTTNINLQADTLADLPAADDQAEETKGGPRFGQFEVKDFTFGAENPSRFAGQPSTVTSGAALHLKALDATD